MRFVLDPEGAVSTAPDTFRLLSAAPDSRADDGHAVGSGVAADRLEGGPNFAAAHAAGVRPLADLLPRTSAVVVALVPPAEPHDPEIIARLGELGFLPGEPVRVIARAFMGDPLAVRVGTGTFALRRSEARCIHVRLEA